MLLVAVSVTVTPETRAAAGAGPATSGPPFYPRAGKRARRSVADRDHLFIRSARTGCLAPPSGPYRRWPVDRWPGCRLTRLAGGETPPAASHSIVVTGGRGPADRASSAASSASSS